jgi:hypothetical protein
MLTRSSLLSIFLVLTIGLVGWNTYASWRKGPWDLPSPSKSNPPALATDKPAAAAVKVATSTDAIVSRNLFDPERGAGATRDAEETSRALQRIRGMVLIGTVIMGDNRTAILQEGAAPSGSPAPSQPPATMRLKLGDNVEGYSLAEIGDKKVVFARNATRVEVMLDYFRKVEIAAPRAPAPGPTVTPATVPPPGPRVVPNLPRRGRIPTPGSPNPES